jgi:rhodanese-related sulfurtransferase
METPMANVQQLTAQEVKQALESASPPVVVDVRNAPEIAAEGTIAGALQIPMNELPMRSAEIPAGRDVICICKVGMRSFNAAAFLRQKGVAASSMAGGMNAWLGAGLPVSR